MKMTHIDGGGSHAICVIMKHCVRKSICDAPYLPARYFRFQRIEERTDIYEETCEKDNERFQSAYAEAVKLTNKLGTGKKKLCICKMLMKRSQIAFL